ncbi:hypothetical protein AAZX31_15G231200 [Glycine max]
MEEKHRDAAPSAADSPTSKPAPSHWSQQEEVQHPQCLRFLLLAKRPHCSTLLPSTMAPSPGPTKPPTTAPTLPPCSPNSSRRRASGRLSMPRLKLNSKLLDLAMPRLTWFPLTAFFNISEEVVIEATDKGNIARLIIIL